MRLIPDDGKPVISPRLAELLGPGAAVWVASGEQPAYAAHPLRTVCAKDFLDEQLRGLACAIPDSVSVGGRTPESERRAAVGALAAKRGGGLWMVKLPRGSRGTQVFPTADPVREVERQLRVSRRVCLQPLLQKPMLHEGRKADLRVYVLTFTDGDGRLRWRFARDAVVMRTCAETYDPRSTAVTVQLTNGWRGGPTLPFEDAEVLDRVQGAVDDVFARLVERKVLLARTTEEGGPRRQVPWLFGLDVFVSEDRREVRLIEMNCLPFILTEGPATERLRELVRGCCGL